MHSVTLVITIVCGTIGVVYSVNMLIKLWQARKSMLESIRQTRTILFAQNEEYQQLVERIIERRCPEDRTADEFRLALIKLETPDFIIEARAAGLNVEEAVKAWYGIRDFWAIEAELL